MSLTSAANCPSVPLNPVEIYARVVDTSSRIISEFFSGRGDTSVKICPYLSTTPAVKKIRKSINQKDKIFEKDFLRISSSEEVILVKKIKYVLGMYFKI